MPELQGKRILVTREAKQAKTFSKEIISAGGIPIEVPLLKIACKEAVNQEEIHSKLGTYHWIIFTSANGVDCFFEQLSDSKQEYLKRMKIAVVGHKTEAALLKYKLSADLIPEVYDADSLAEIFLKKYQAGESILLVRGSMSRDVLPRVFTNKGIGFDAIEVYETKINQENAILLEDVLEKEQLDFITFTSPSTIEAFVKLGGKFGYTPCVCIGTTTEQAAKDFGCPMILTAEIFTIEGMIDVMHKHIR